MKFQSVCIAAFLVIALGFGAGYYTSRLVEGNEAKVQTKNINTKAEATPLPKPTPTKTPAPPQEDKEASAPGEAYFMNESDKEGKQYYMLKEYIGRIAVYKVYQTGEMTLMSIIDAATDALPESDKKLLQQGISVATEEEMLQLIEDYTS